MNSGYDTDLTMKELWSNLARDFRSWTYGELGQRHEKHLRAGDLASFRNEPWADKLNAPISICKAQYQLELLFKRYRFKADEFTDKELEARTIQSFLDTQERVSHPMELSQTTEVVLAIAARIIAEVLGEFSEEELMLNCRIGKKATLGNPLHRSYLDVKLQDAITGSTEQIEWFERYLSTDPLLVDVIRDCQGKQAIDYKVCDTLTAALVAKSYKALRTILPNTFIGAFRTKGLGKMLEVRLKTFCGLDIKKLQSIHRRLVKEASKTRHLVTADLTAASDSIVLALLERLLPEEWLTELSLGRITHALFNGTVVKMETYMTMGIGYTFPLQTLVFYALLKAIAEATKIRGRISVYGDDLIYPRALHKYVAAIFPRLHLKINKDKTYVNTYFRESCGADCYHGSDVRPFNPEGQHQMLRRKHYIVFLYKTINGLLQRWDPLEIPGTMKFLLAEILHVDGKILQVPPSYPDESGLKVSYPTKEFGYVPVTRCRRYFGFTFSYLRIQNQNRVVLKQSPHYWERLQIATCNCMEDEENPYAFRGDLATSCKAYIKSLTFSVDAFLWQRLKNRPLPKRYNAWGKRTYRLLAHEKHKTDQRIERKQGSTSVWA